MKKLVCLSLLATIAGCWSNAPTTAVPTQTAAVSVPAESTTDSTTGVSPNSVNKVIVIDVRSQEEWDSGHIGQAIHIPYTEIAERISEVSDNKDAKIVVYCAAGVRAGKAKTTLESLGFTNVENAGGYDDVKERFKE